jgi:hypothetical protein
MAIIVNRRDFTEDTNCTSFQWWIGVFDPVFDASEFIYFS